MSVVGSPVRVGVRAGRRRVSAALYICARIRTADDAAWISRDELFVTRTVMGRSPWAVSRISIRARRRRVSAALYICARIRTAIDFTWRIRDDVGVTSAVMGIVGSPVRVGVRAGRRCDSAAIGVRA